MRSRNDLLNDNILMAHNHPIERAENILDNIRNYNYSSFRDFDALNSDNQSNISENSNDYL